MSVCAVFDSQTGELVNRIVAEVTDPPPDGCYLVDWPEGKFWDGEKFVDALPPPVEDIPATTEEPPPPDLLTSEG